MGPTDRPPVLRLQGKVAIVTAATAGIGLAIAARLGKEGAKIVISSRRKDNVDEALRQLKQQGVDCCGCVCHVGSRDHLKQLVQLTLDTYGKIDILISNAAVNPAAGPVLQTPDAAIDKILEINVRSPIILTKEVAPHLNPGSAIVYISSYTAFNPSPPIPVYAISKTALLGLTKALAEELGPKGIRVNCIAPGDLHQVLAFVTDTCIYAQNLASIHPPPGPAHLVLMKRAELKFKERCISCYILAAQMHACRQHLQSSGLLAGWQQMTT